MINLLPPEFKKQQKFAKLNSGIRQYVVIAVLVGILLSATMLVGNLYTSFFIDEVETQLAEKQKEVAKYKKMESRARDINTQLKKFSTITEQTTRYSNVLTDISTSLPKNTRIAELLLDGSAENQFKLSVTATSREVALSVQPTLVATDRFSYVDIQEYSNKGSTHSIELVLAFTDEEAARR